VLQDGGVLEGTFLHTGDRYVLSRNGSTLEIPAARVLVACRSLVEAYDARRQQIQQPSADAHLALAAWCLRYNLLPQAAREIVDARGLEPNNGRLALFERRLAAASAPRPPRSARVDGNVKPAAHLEVAASQAEIEPAAIAIDDLPPGAIELFTRRVQPILVNNCTTAGCHPPGSEQQFQLDRALLHGLANRRSTMKNLAATLAIVDHQQPHLSRLLTVPRQAHGGMRSPVFGPRHVAAFSHVVDWVALVTKANTPEEEPALPTTQLDAEPAAAESLEDSRRTHAPALQIGGEVILPLSAPQRDDPRGGGAVRKEIRFGAQLRSWQPKDPFDPEIFNRQHRAHMQQ
jgi:hypothetical protein